ncbi:uncharacterized protein N7482_004460 [Penicillium canariense]|uniref:Peptidase A1 domain-containing protein n=1 Tax=Penicillium canariense TaxID=189055 RepID=A0A9W9LQ39_9EURO|nr:uncharacterized protein N7482_004460 [Penicillium canariense]KAJ5168866.1 hypothetical protein N7482_004460 [Penicillium canariense]
MNNSVGVGIPSVLLVLGHWLFFNARITQPLSPLILTWSDKSYGPDGPWQAVSVKIGTPSQTVALYPVGTWSCAILLSTICANLSETTTWYASNAGLYDRNASMSAGPDAVDSKSYKALDDLATPGMAGRSVFYDDFDIGGLIIPNVSMTGIYDGYQTYPNGRNYPIEVGTLSFGAPTLTHQWGYTMMMVASYLYTSNDTPSYSYGMHIGSAALGIPGSAVLGGYDKNRIAGEVSAQPFAPFDSTNPGGDLIIGLFDIGVGVASGGSPWSFNEKSGLLSQSNSSLMAPVTVQLAPIKPYMYLAPSTCDAITSLLPATFDSDLGLYLWKTDSDQYRSVQSPAYLSFTFEKDSTNSKNITIKVPFALLNLPLQAPLVNEDTPYFPCFPTDGPYYLGRAFLQAAFVGENYGTGDGSGTWFLAQAPGPGLVDISTSTTIAVGDSTIPATDNSWEVSWSSHWTELSSSQTGNITASNSNSTSTSPSSSGLSQGAKTGIGVGVGLGAAIVVCALAWALNMRRRRKDEKDSGDPSSTSSPGGTSSGYWQPVAQEMARSDDHSNLHEAPIMPAKQDQHYELS